MPIDQNMTRDQSELKEGADYKVSKWREHDNFECTKCVYATIYWFKMEEHYELEEVHGHIWGSESKAPDENAPPPEAVRKLNW